MRIKKKSLTALGLALDRAERRIATLTGIPEWDAWLRKQTAFRRIEHADLGSLDPGSLDRAFQRLPALYQVAVLRRLRQLSKWPKGLSLAWSDVMDGTNHVPGEDREAELRYKRYLVGRPVAEKAAQLLSTLLVYADTRLEAWPARAATVAREEALSLQPKTEKDRDRFRDLSRISDTRSKLDALMWTESQVRLAADIAAELARADAQVAYDIALAERQRIYGMRASVWRATLIPTVPAVPARPNSAFGPDGEATAAVDHADYLARSARSLAVRAGERRRLAWLTWQAACRDKEPADDQAHLRNMARARQVEATSEGWLADDYEAASTRARIETWGYEEVARACRAASVRARLRDDIGVTDAHTCQILGLLGGPKADGNSVLASDWSLDRAREQSALNQETLERQVYVRRDEAGQPVIGAHGLPETFTGAEAARAHRHAMQSQRYALSLGIQELGQRRGWTLLLLTTTLPGEWHANPSKGRSRYNPALGPIEARKELQSRHHRAMALLAHHDVRIISPRAREGQEDGTPHDHLAAFVHPDDVPKVYAAFSRQFPEPSEFKARNLEEAAELAPDVAEKERLLARAHKLRDRLEKIPMSKRIACHARVWTTTEQAMDTDAKATIASYIYGYAAKCLADATDENDSAARNAVWAGQRRIRRWEIVGLRRGLRGQWQIIHRQHDRPNDELQGAIWDAMQEHRWADALEMLDALRELTVPPVVWDYIDERGLGGRPRRVPLALRSTGRPIHEVEESDVLFRQRQDGTRWVRMTRDEWEEEQAHEKRKLRAQLDIGGPLAVMESFPRARADAPALDSDMSPPVTEVGACLAEEIESAGEEEVSGPDWWASHTAMAECAADWVRRRSSKTDIDDNIGLDDAC
jgi:hypothetical protein